MKNEFVATGLVLNEQKDKILLIFHRKFGKWMPPGGHLEPNELPHEAVAREVFEETGVKAAVLCSGRPLVLASQGEQPLPVPYCILHERIPASPKQDEHMHVDFIYLMQAAEQNLVPALQEVREARWFSKSEALVCQTFESVKALCQQIF